MVVQNKRQRLSSRSLLSSCTTVLWGVQVLLSLPVITSAFLSVPAQAPSFQSRHDNIVTVRRRQTSESNNNDDMMEPFRDENENKDKFKQVKYKQAKKEQQANAAMDLPGQPLVRTLAGGSNLMFSMARRMWDPKAMSGVDSGSASASVSSSSSSLLQVLASREEYAALIWKNARKRNKPGMWRYAIRAFDRMIDEKPLSLLTTHYEGAMTACAKLGLWERALQIYSQVYEREASLRSKLSAGKKAKARLVLPVQVTDNMVGSVLRACVRASRQRQGELVLTLSDDDDHECVVDASTSSSSSNCNMREVRLQRIPLDAVILLLQEIEERHGMPLTARHLNPVAAAYLSLGLVSDAAALLQSNLSDRTTGTEPEDGDARFNVNDLTAKDKGSYSLLVQGSVSDGDWVAAVHALTTMTEAGLYPAARHLNAWTEVSERKTKQRATRSWKKKRDESYLDSVR